MFVTIMNVMKEVVFQAALDARFTFENNDKADDEDDGPFFHQNENDVWISSKSPIKS